MDFKAKKKFGQNFLKDEKVQKRFADEVKKMVEKYPSVVYLAEVGPGLGYITKHVLEWSKPLTVFEIDTDAIDFLNNTYDSSKLSVHYMDALKDTAKIGSFFHEQPFLLYSNLPFNIGSRLLVELTLYYPNTPLVVVLQKEVIKKLFSQKDITFFKAWLTLFWDFKHGFNISPTAFVPQPKVTSSLVSANPVILPDCLRTLEQRIKALELVKKLFAMPNKTLNNNLKNSGFSIEQINLFFSEQQLEITTRITVENYKKLLISLIEFTQRLT
jgi:16S rRNA (adenine1518-N6/adenine1519-N6)-dimethyltransferase